jgi:serine O-acetyltransferase
VPASHQYDDLVATEGSSPPSSPRGLRGDLARLFSERGTSRGKPSLAFALERAVTRPGPLALVLYRASHRLWTQGLEFPAELLWRINLFLTGADIHPGAEIGGGLRITHTSGLVVGKGVRIGSNVTILHGVTLGGSAKGWFDGVFEDGFPDIGDDTEIMAGAKVLGPITVGRGCFIGANAVLARDLPDGEAYTPGRELSELRKKVDELSRKVAELEAGRKKPAARRTTPTKRPT